MNKKLITLTAAAVLSVSVLFGATGLCADKVEDNTKMEGAEIACDDNGYTFDMFKEELKDDISKEDLAKVKTLFEKAVKLDQDACTAWDELYTMDIFKFDEGNAIEGFTFDIFKQELKSNLSKDILSKVESMFNKAIAIEKECKFDEASKVWDEIYAMDIFNFDVSCSEATCAEYTFDAFKTELKENISKEDLAKVKALFEKAMNLEQNNQFDEAKPVWEELYSMDIFETEMAACEIAVPEYTFDIFKEELKDNISKEDLAKAKTLFENATALDKKAMDAWDELYQLDIFNDDFLDEYTFDQFKEDLIQGVSKDNLDKAESLFDKALNFEKKGELEQAQQVWDELYSMDIFDDETDMNFSTAEAK